jgi:histidine triad (HIT) family protein
MENCIFCKIANKELPSSILYEDEDVIAFLDIKPVNEGHTLVIPKKHFVTLDDCDEEVAKHLIVVLKRLNISVCKAVNCEGIFNAAMNGESAGQEVFHLHFHIIPRFKDDGFGFRFPKSYEIKKERKMLDEIAARIRKEI